MTGAEKSVSKAVVLKYLKALPAPFIVCKGRNKLAERIKRIAEENDVEIVRKDELADNLYEFEEGDYIPEELYEVTAGILAFVYNLQKKK
ncbi:MAG: EscU/YscU/HrcU family type III secretion system export apparatus switch protein [Spirochaetales bacterium]|uniref:EscU/YscU/HrcU family type III secretion system export apparatus switch protein n=1 Tax=Candidatus Thalassospirochaeta sargassi TaxID=3119039 RepID=A0AAJ1IAR3_9SPIO|nr:EscU/YscU/HrcU family type III secretion system export apparatus switch protein [Spirochaetales bacterium]